MIFDNQICVQMNVQNVHNGLWMEIATATRGEKLDTVTNHVCFVVSVNPEELAILNVPWLLVIIDSQ